MRIEALIGGGMQPTEPAIAKKELSETAFGDLLAQEIEHSEGPSTATTTPLGGPTAASLPFPAAPLGMGAPEDVAVGIEDTLNRWAALADRLEAGTGSARDIQAQIAALVDSTQAIQESANGLPDGHPLRQLADELTVFSSVESIKWQRGDYL